VHSTPQDFQSVQDFLSHPVVLQLLARGNLTVHTGSNPPNIEGRYDVTASIRGGGICGQADALCHGISRALEKSDPTMRAPLKRKGFLTRDARKKERKKYGQKGARARYQFSKR